MYLAELISKITINKKAIKISKALTPYQAVDIVKKKIA